MQGAEFLFTSESVIHRVSAAQTFAATPVTMLSRVVVTTPAEVLRVVSEGGGMRQFSPHVRKVTIKLEAS